MSENDYSAEYVSAKKPAEIAQEMSEMSQRRRRSDDRCRVFRGVLEEADKAINPPDREGISFATWNERLKAATAKIRSALA
jgi:hypothetical protein